MLYNITQGSVYPGVSNDLGCISSVYKTYRVHFHNPIYRGTNDPYWLNKKERKGKDKHCLGNVAQYESLNKA